MNNFKYCYQYINFDRLFNGGHPHNSNKIWIYPREKIIRDLIQAILNIGFLITNNLNNYLKRKERKG